MAMTCIYGGKECDGCTACQKDEDIFKCPCCGIELGYTEDLFIDKSGDVVGCEYCIKRKEAGEILSEN